MKGLLQSKIFRKNLKKWLCMYVGALMILTTVVTYSKYISAFNSEPENARVTKFDVTINNLTENSCLDETDPNCIKYRPTTPLEYEFTVNPTFEVYTLLATNVYLNNDFEILKLEEVSPTSRILFDTTNDKDIANVEDIKIVDRKIQSDYPKDLKDSKGEKIGTITAYDATTKDGKIIEEIISKDLNEKIIETKYVITCLDSSNSSDPVVKRTLTVKDGITSNKMTISRYVEAADFAGKTYKVTVKYKYDADTYQKLTSKNLEAFDVGYSATQNKK